MSFVKKIAGLFSCVLLCLIFSVNSFAGTIDGVRIGQGIGGVRIVLDADSEFDYKAFLLTAPQRLVVDVKNAKVNSKIEKYKENGSFVSSPRLGVADGNSTRIVFDLQKPAIIKKVFMLKPQANFGWRFVVDLSLTTEREFNSKAGNQYAFTNGKSANYAENSTSSAKPKKEVVNAKRIIVLDPGHGGKDPGAIGYTGIYEKHIVLAMAKELKKQLESNGYTVYLTRSTDVFIPLRDRVKIARKYKPDLFLSIHADSTKNRTAKGLSVYTLSENASDKEAEALAERENKADVIAGLNLVEHSKEVSDILINLAQRESMNRSSEFATFMVQEMRKTTNIVSETHRFAGFAVLKAPDVPSVLLEMGYLSNSAEEKLLKQETYRKKLATSTKSAIEKYFDNMQRASLF